MDTHTKAQRSYNMSRIRSKWTAPERRIHNFLKGWKIRHKMHPKIKGTPDVVLPKIKLAIFIHGCFWHKCPVCYRKPKSNKKYWEKKIKLNLNRDKEAKRSLIKQGFEVIELWEHELKGDFEKSVLKILNS